MIINALMQKHISINYCLSGLFTNSQFIFNIQNAKYNYTIAFIVVIHLKVTISSTMEMSGTIYLLMKTIFTQSLLSFSEMMGHHKYD
jgi:hypothetical protein